MESVAAVSLASESVLQGSHPAHPGAGDTADDAVQVRMARFGDECGDPALVDGIRRLLLPAAALALRTAEDEVDLFHDGSPETLVQTGPDLVLQKLELLHPRRVGDPDEQTTFLDPDRLGPPGQKVAHHVPPEVPHEVGSELLPEVEPLQEAVQDVSGGIERALGHLGQVRPALGAGQEGGLPAGTDGRKRCPQRVDLRPGLGVGSHNI